MRLHILLAIAFSVLFPNFALGEDSVLYLSFTDGRTDEVFLLSQYPKIRFEDNAILFDYDGKTLEFDRSFVKSYGFKGISEVIAIEQDMAKDIIGQTFSLSGRILSFRPMLSERKFAVFDLNGHLMIQCCIPLEGGNLDLSSLESGVYAIRVNNMYIKLLLR